jgi:hypothetical protein
MTFKTHLAVTALVLAALLSAPQAHAGRACEEAAPTTEQVVQGMNLAQATRKKLDSSGAEVVLLARAGQDLSRYNVQWSHMGYAYRDAGTQAWRVVHLLNHCGTDQSALYRQGLGEFFMDNPHKYQAAYVSLSPSIQQALKPMLANDALLRRWHNPTYNMVAYPWSTTYQQSNQWVLEILALASNPRLQSRHEAQRWLQHKGYEPAVLHVGAVQRAGARVSSANISFDDHPNAKRFNGRIETITADSIFSWLRVTAQADGEVIVR